MKKSRLKFFVLPATLCLIDLMGYILYNGGRKEKQGMAKFIKEPELTVKEVQLLYDCLSRAAEKEDLTKEEMDLYYELTECLGSQPETYE